MNGYNILIPSSCQQTSPELTLPIMDALQYLGHTPVVLDMASMAAMYQELRYERHGCYEIFGFYANDLIREGKIDFGISVGLGLILEDPMKAEAHNLVEESGLPNVIYLHHRTGAALEKLKSIGAKTWQHTYFVSSCKSHTDDLRESGIVLAETLAPGTSARLFYPQDQAPADAAFAAKRDDGWATEGFDVSFIGSYSPLRDKLLSALARAGIRLAVFGDAGWKQSKELQPFYRNQARYLQDVNTIYNHSSINLDLPYDDQQAPGYVSSRLFDCLASGSFMLTYGRPALAEHFEPEHELATFETGHNGDAVILILQSVKYYLEQDIDRLALAARGRRRVMSRHLWQHRLEVLIPRMEMHLLQTAVH
jgi:hypothetical protein